MSTRAVALSVVLVVVIAAGFVAAGVWLEVSPGGVAAIVAAVAFGASMVGLMALLLTLMGAVRDLSAEVTKLSEEVIPLIGGVSETVSGVNTELARVDAIVASVQHVSERAEGIADVVHTAVSSPLIKLIAFASGTGAAVRTARKS